jgi:ATP-dependent Clp protease protease subunit
MSYIPYVVEKMPGGGERTSDIFSRLLKDRIVMLTGEVNDQIAASIVAQFLFLQAEDSKKDIYFYINSPGGHIHSGMAILDCLNFITNRVITICLGMAASMGSFLLAAGEKGNRYSLPNSKIMIHQPLGGAQGQATDIAIQAEEIIKTKNNLNKMLSNFTGQTLETIKKDTDRDNYMTAQEAKEYGLIDHVISKASDIK